MKLQRKYFVIGRAESLRSDPNIVRRFDRGTDPRSDLIQYEFARHSSHKADDYLLHCSEALELG